MKKLVALLVLCTAVHSAKPFPVLDPALYRIKDALSGPRMNDDASVRYSRDLPEQELQFIEKRKGHVQRALRKMLGEDVSREHVPTIAFCCSGGGYRAMLSSLGTLIGADDIGVLDAAMYTAGLSGSTWAMAPWIISGLSPREYQELLIPKLASAWRKKPRNARAIGRSVARRYVTGQAIGPVDVYGGLLANALLSGFGMEPQHITLADSHAKVASGKWPLPIYTAAWVERPFRRTRPYLYEWMEFTPFEVGSTHKPGFIPTWALGRFFRGGKTQNHAMQLSLGYLLGIFGSAFTLHFRDLVNVVGDELHAPLAFALRQAAAIPAIGLGRPIPARVPDFTTNVPVVLQRLIRRLFVTTLVDAGLIFNLPLPPLMRPERKVDIIICSDASAGLYRKSPFAKAKEWLRARGIALPSGDYRAAASSKEIAIFEDENNPDMPIIIYLPLVKNDKYSTTFNPQAMLKKGGSYLTTTNFVYTDGQARELSGLMETTIKQHKDEIYDVIRRVIARKKTPSN